MSVATVTAKTMGGVQVTSKVISNVSKFFFDLDRLVLLVYVGGDAQEYSLTGVTTITCTISSGVYTLTVS